MRKYTKYTKLILEPIIKKSKSWAQVCRELQLQPATGSQSHIKKVSVDFNIDFSHFTGRGWNKGKTFPQRGRPIEFYLVNHGPFIHSHKLKIKLIKCGIKKEECEECKIQTWDGHIIPIELDHINNDHYDNRLENLKILCPNCHAIKTRIERARLAQRKEATALEAGQ